MSNFEKINKFLTENTKIKIEIKKYIIDLLKHKHYPILNETTYPLLIQNALFYDKNKVLYIKSDYLSYGLLEYFKDLFKIEDINSYDSFLEFYKLAKEKIIKTNNHYVILKDFTVFIILYFNQLKKWEFEEVFLNLLPNDTNRDYWICVIW